MTQITPKQVKKMTDLELLSHLHKFPYYSQYEDKGAYKVAEYRLALIRGGRYMATGNVKALFTR